MLEPFPADAEIWILLVEDDDDDALFVERTLDDMEEAIHFERAAHGLEAQEMLLRSGPNGPVPDIIVLDLNMPLMDGADFLAWLRSDLRFASVVVVILTTTKDHDVLRRLLATGANAAISKSLGDEAIQELSQVILDLWGHGQVNSLKSILDSELPLDMSTLRPVVVGSEGIRREIRHVLSRWGVRHIEEADDLAECANVIDVFRPNIILLDGDAPEAQSDSFSALFASREGRSIPVLMLTAHIRRAEVTNARDRGVAEFVKLPLSETVLRQRLATLLRVSH